MGRPSASTEARQAVSTTDQHAAPARGQRAVFAIDQRAALARGGLRSAPRFSSFAQRGATRCPRGIVLRVDPAPPRKWGYSPLGGFFFAAQLLRAVGFNPSCRRSRWRGRRPQEAAAVRFFANFPRASQWRIRPCEARTELIIEREAACATGWAAIAKIAI
jgi:hypothetical protein